MEFVYNSTFPSQPIHRQQGLFLFIIDINESKDNGYDAIHLLLMFF